MKRQYQTPAVNVVEIEQQSILAGSYTENTIDIEQQEGGMLRAPRSANSSFFDDGSSLNEE
jgi:hypothetical protein